MNRFEALYRDSCGRRLRQSLANNNTHLDHKPKRNLSQPHCEDRWTQAIRRHLERVACKNALSRAIKEQREAEAMRECTFKPRLVRRLPYKSKKSISLEDDGEAKCGAYANKDQLETIREHMIDLAQQQKDLIDDLHNLSEEDENTEAVLQRELEQEFSVVRSRRDEERLLYDYECKQHEDYSRILTHRLSIMKHLTRLENVFLRLQALSNGHEFPDCRFNSALVSELKNQPWFEAALNSKKAEARTRRFMYSATFAVISRRTHSMSVPPSASRASVVPLSYEYPHHNGSYPNNARTSIGSVSGTAMRNGNAERHMSRRTVGGDTMPFHTAPVFVSTQDEDAGRSSDHDRNNGATSTSINKTNAVQIKHPTPPQRMPSANSRAFLRKETIHANKNTNLGCNENIATGTRVVPDPRNQSTVLQSAELKPTYQTQAVNLNAKEPKALPTSVDTHPSPVPISPSFSASPQFENKAPNINSLFPSYAAPPPPVSRLQNPGIAYYANSSGTYTRAPVFYRGGPPVGAYAVDARPVVRTSDSLISGNVTSENGNKQSMFSAFFNRAMLPNLFA